MFPVPAGQVPFLLQGFRLSHSPFQSSAIKMKYPSVVGSKAFECSVSSHLVAEMVGHAPEVAITTIAPTSFLTSVVYFSLIFKKEIYQ